MSQHLADLITAEALGNELRLWLKSSSYTRRLLLGAAGDPWESASKYLAYFSQAHGLLKPDVAVLEVGELFDSFLRKDPHLKGELGAKRKLSYPLRRLLEEPAARELLAETVEAVANQLRSRSPLVLAMPSPKSWLLEASRAAGREDFEPDPDTVEDAAMYLADLVRSVSATPVGGILLEEAESLLGPVELELYRPLLNLAKHYRWPLALRLGNREVVEGPAVSEVEVFIGCKNLPSSGGVRGIDVTAALWGDGALPDLETGAFYFLEVPEDALPERVLERLGGLRGNC